MKKFFGPFFFVLFFAAFAHAQTAQQLPVPVQKPVITDLGNGPLKLRVVQTYAYIFTSQGTGTGSTSGSSTTLTLTGTPTTPPVLGAYISGTGITDGTTVAGYNGTTTITLSAPMTVPGGTSLSWGAACPASVPSSSVYAQASVMAEFWPWYTRSRICAASPGGPLGSLLVLPYETASNGGAPTGPAGGDLTGTYPDPQIAAGAIVNADINNSAAIALSKLAPQAANTVVGALSATTPSALAMPDTSGATNALGWTAGVGFGVKTLPGGTVTSVGWTGGIVSVGTPTTTPAFTVAGVSGGVPYFNSTSSWTSSAALTAGEVMVGGGAGAAPTTNPGGGVRTITSTATSALAVGPNGATNPTFNVNANTASAANGVEVVGRAAGAFTSINTISSATNEGLVVNAKGSGQIVLAAQSSGVVNSRTQLTLGDAGTTSGSLAFLSATSGTVTFNPVAGALGSNVITVPAITGTLPVKIASGTITLGTSAITSGSCASIVTVAASGVATTDVVSVGLNARLSTVTGYSAAITGALRIDVYPTAGNINAEVCNPTGSSITPGGVTLNWNVIR